MALMSRIVSTTHLRNNQECVRVGGYVSTSFIIIWENISPQKGVKKNLFLARSRSNDVLFLNLFPIGSIYAISPRNKGRFPHRGTSASTSASLPRNRVKRFLMCQQSDARRDRRRRRIYFRVKVESKVDAILRKKMYHFSPSISVAYCHIYLFRLFPRFSVELRARLIFSDRIFSGGKMISPLTRHHRSSEPLPPLIIYSGNVVLLHFQILGQIISIRYHFRDNGPK